MSIPSSGRGTSHRGGAVTAAGGTGGMAIPRGHPSLVPSEVRLPLKPNVGAFQPQATNHLIFSITVGGPKTNKGRLRGIRPELTENRQLNSTQLNSTKLLCQVKG